MRAATRGTRGKSRPRKAAQSGHVQFPQGLSPIPLCRQGAAGVGTSGTTMQQTSDVKHYEELVRRQRLAKINRTSNTMNRVGVATQRTLQRRTTKAILNRNEMKATPKRTTTSGTRSFSTLGHRKFPMSALEGGRRGRSRYASRFGRRGYGQGQPYPYQKWTVHQAANRRSKV